MNDSRLLGAALACVLIFNLPPSTAATLSVSALDWGSYFASGLHNPTNDSYLVGQSADSTSSIEIRNWFAFDLNGISLGANEAISSASLRIITDGNYVGDAIEQYVLTSVESDVNDVIGGQSAGSNAGVNIFNDLANGNLYGSQDISQSIFTNNATISINLTGVNALSDITSATGGLLAVGGFLNSLAPGYNQQLFSASGGLGAQSAAVLTIQTTTVPIPAAVWLFGSGLLGFIGIARQKKAA